MQNRYTEIEKDGVKKYQIQGNDEYVMRKCEEIIISLENKNENEDVVLTFINNQTKGKVEHNLEKLNKEINKHILDVDNRLNKNDSSSEKIIDNKGSRKLTKLLGSQGLASDDNRYTGIKEDKDGKTRYQLRYVCPKCEEKGKHFIPQNTPAVNCHKCNEEMKVKSVEDDYHIQKDVFNNFYYAGLYKPKLY